MSWPAIPGCTTEASLSLGFFIWVRPAHPCLPGVVRREEGKWGLEGEPAHKGLRGEQT